MSESVDASELAAIWGGGGHAKAAGFKIKDSNFEKSGQQIIDKIKEYQAKRLNLDSFIEQTETPIPKNEINFSALEQAEPNQKIPTTVELNESELPNEDKKSTTHKISKKEKTKLEPGVRYKFEE
jgi:hypothetical protein